MSNNANPSRAASNSRANEKTGNCFAPESCRNIIQPGHSFRTLQRRQVWIQYNTLHIDCDIPIARIYTNMNTSGKNLSIALSLRCLSLNPRRCRYHSLFTKRQGNSTFSVCLVHSQNFPPHFDFGKPTHNSCSPQKNVGLDLVFQFFASWLWVSPATLDHFACIGKQPWLERPCNAWGWVKGKWHIQLLIPSKESADPSFFKGERA